MEDIPLLDIPDNPYGMDIPLLSPIVSSSQSPTISPMAFPPSLDVPAFPTGDAVSPPPPPLIHPNQGISSGPA